MSETKKGQFVTEPRPRPRHTPVVIANYSPFRLVLRANDSWEPTLEQINKVDYDYVKLCRLSTFIDVGIAPLSLAVSFDGTLILPATEDYRNAEKALDKFNETLGIMLLGGVYSEAIHAEDLGIGSLFFDGYLNNAGRGTGLNATFHSALRTKSVGPLDSIRLLQPRVIRVHELEEAYKKGKEVFQQLDGLSPSLLLNGVSSYAKKQWVEGLIFTWTAVEQIINIIWEREILSKSSEGAIEGRRKFLDDPRTWTTSTRIELLYQQKLIGADEYKLLNTARKARNDFVHRATVLTSEKVKAVVDVLFRLISLIITDYKNVNGLDSILESVYNNQREDLYPKKTSFSTSEVTHWRSIPQLPGDSHWEGDYEIIDELVLQPLSKPPK